MQVQAGRGERVKVQYGALNYDVGGGGGGGGSGVGVGGGGGGGGKGAALDRLTPRSW